MTVEERADRLLDETNKQIIEDLANGMLDFYAWKQDSSLINEAEFNEIVELSAIKHPAVYHLLLQNVVKDLANDKFVKVYKLTGLAIIILNLALKTDAGDEEYSKFYSSEASRGLNDSDDMNEVNACL